MNATAQTAGLSSQQAKGPQACKLVIFDCDGVLVDSESIAVDMLLEMIRAAGGEITREAAYERFLGCSLARIVAELEERHQITVTEGLLESMRIGLYDRFRKELQPIPGIAGALDRLAQPFCVASSSQPERIRLSLSLTRLEERFNGNIFSATMVKHGKPAPDLFLYAARQMNVEPQACVVVEDSPAGVTAAKSAGMRVISFMGGSHAVPAGLDAKVRALEPDLILDTMDRLPEAIAELEAVKREA